MMCDYAGHEMRTEGRVHLLHRGRAQDTMTTEDSVWTMHYTPFIP